MATAYFRDGSSSLGFGTNTVYQPSFPVNVGLSLHSYATSKPTYTTTNRLYGTTNTRWQTERAKQSDRNTIWTFWGTTLTAGYDDITAIDNRGRMLFECSWNDWEESWSKENGGLYNINYNLQSPIPWTPPCLGAYLMSDDTLDNHNLQGDDLTASGATIVNNVTDSAVLRLNGSALRFTGSGAVKTGTTSNIEWTRSSKENPITLFCQAMVSATIANGEMYLLELQSGSNVYRIVLDSSNDVTGQLGLNGVTKVSKGSGIYHSMSNDTWYDIAFTYNPVNEQNYLYIKASGDSSFTDFLSGSSAITDQVGTYNGDTRMDVGNWYTINMLRNTLTTTVQAGEYVYVQNPMIFDGFLTAFDFNTLRRLCYLWSKETTGVHPK